MRTVIHDEFAARLAVLNIGDLYTMGPQEAAFAARDLLQLTTVIPSQANEVVTSNGDVVAGTKTACFLDALKGLPVVLPLSGRTSAFDSSGHCVEGCLSDTPASHQP